MIKLHIINVKKVISMFFFKLNNIFNIIDELIVGLINNKVHYISGNYSIRLYIYNTNKIYDDILFYKKRYPQYISFIETKLVLSNERLYSIEIKYYNYLTDLFLYKLNNYVVESLDIFKYRYCEYIDIDEQKNLFINFDIFIRNMIKFKKIINKYITDDKYEHIQLSYFVINNLIKKYIPHYEKSMQFYKTNISKPITKHTLLNYFFKLNNRKGYKSIRQHFF